MLAILLVIAFIAGWLACQFFAARSLRRTAARTRAVLHIDRCTGAATYRSPSAMRRLGIVGPAQGYGPCKPGAGGGS